MTFNKAIEEMFKGKTVKLPYWCCDACLYINHGGGISHGLDDSNQLNAYELLSDDWEIVE